MCLSPQAVVEILGAERPEIAEYRQEDDRVSGHDQAGGAPLDLRERNETTLGHVSAIIGVRTRPRPPNRGFTTSKKL